MAFRVVKQIYPAPSSSGDFTDPPWATRNVYIASSSDMQMWQFNNESDAITKMNELTGSESTGRKYKVVEV